MNALKAALLLAAIAFLIPLCVAAVPLNAPNIEALIPDVHDKRPNEVRALIVRRLGPPVRDVGSGLRIEQWDVDGGVLTFHPLVGPSFEKDGVHMRLVRTTNRAAACLFGTYEMTTLPEGPHGLRYWIGNVSLRASRYEYIGTRQNLDHRTGQTDNFFMLHPRGSVRIAWTSGATPDTRLEELADGTCVATATFVPRDNQGNSVYRIVAYRSSMTLAFEREAMSFQMDRGWVNYWR
jgi:hypothetical protein